jgi:hypothetical protein
MSEQAIPPKGMRPMRDFDPSQPAILHDRLNDAIVTWTGELKNHWRENAAYEQDGTVNWAAARSTDGATCWAGRRLASVRRRPRTTAARRQSTRDRQPSVATRASPPPSPGGGGSANARSA